MRSTLLTAVLFMILAAFSANLTAQGCAPPPSSDDDGARIFGFLQPQFEYRQTHPTGSESSFTFNRARIGIMGNIPYDIQYYAVVEASQFKRGPYLLDAFISYTRFPFLKVSVGSFKSPFTLEMSRPCNQLNTIYRSRIISTLVAPDRDLGVMLSGQLLDEKLSYSLAFTNGTGLRNVFNPDDTGFDNNHGKTVHSRIQFSPLSFLKIGAGVQYGTHPSVVEDKKEEDSRLRYAADIQLSLLQNRLELVGEYVAGEDKGSYVVNTGGCGGEILIIEGDQKRNGYYFTAMYKIMDNLQPLVRFESYNYNPESSKGVDYTTVFGLNYWFNDMTRIQLNYLYNAEKRLEVRNDEFIVQFQVTF